MKRLFIFITVVCALFVTSCYEDSTTNDRISNLENDKIASIEEQINAILSTLSVLKEETHPLILSKIGVLESNAESNAELIATLKAQAESVANQISELTNHCKQLEDSIGLYGEKEWIETTFATLEQYANLQSVVASLQANISGLSEEIKSAITKVESSMKDWVSVQLSSYCTIAEMEAQLAELRAANKDNDEAITAKIAELEKTIEGVYQEITAAYQQAIADAISNNNGEINKKIAKDIASAETRIDSKLETINAEINDIKVRLNILEAKISDIESQITKINATLDLLQMVNALLDERLISLEAKLAHDEKTYLAQIEELKAKIAGLEAEKAEIEKSIADNSADIEKLNLELEACVEYIRSLQNELIDMQAVMDKLQCEIQAEIAAIEAEQALLEEQIEALKAYVDNELSKKADKDWAEATFATLEQYAQMQTLLDELQQQIASLKQDENEGGTNVDSSAIEDAIKAAEESMKDWVAEELAGYCTISQLEAKLEVLRKELDQNGAYTQDQIAGMEARIAELSEQLAAMMMAYKKALDDISAILHNYQAENDARIHDILAEMEEMQVRHTEDIAYIKNTIDKLWDFIYNRIQSITYIPQYTDEKATIIKTLNVDEGVGELDFLILPKEAVKKIQVNDVSMKAVETISRAVNFIDMPIISVKTTDLANGVLTVRVSGKNLGDDFYEGKKEFKATLIISNGENEISSEFITLTPQVEEGSTSTNNKIFYTSSDGNIVTPNATDVFGANIVSNTYENGQGIITFDGEVTIIGENAFYQRIKLTSIIIPDSVTKIGNSAFYNCSKLTSVTIPDSVTTIGEEAFRICFSLTNATIPNSVTTIGGSAFGGCKRLTSVTIPDSVTKIGEGAFTSCNKLKAFYGKFASADNRCLIVDGVLEAFAPAGLTEYTIPDSVTTIGHGAFSNSNLTSVTIPNNITKIEDSGFWNCDSLTSVTIEDSVTTIGEEAFYNCSALTSVTIGNGVSSIGHHAFYDCESLKEVYCKPTTPPSLGGSYVFYNNASDRKIYVPTTSVSAYKVASRWNEYADYIFPMPEESQNNKIFYTSSDGNVIEPNKTDVFGANIVSNTYENGQGVITFDGEVTTIGKEAFKGCSTLTSVTIPDSVTKIGNQAFAGCSSLKRVDITDLEAWCRIDFDNAAVSNPSYYAGNLYLNGELVENLVIPESITELKPMVFLGLKCLKSVTFHNRITSIGNWAFKYCSSLTSVTIPDSVTTIGWYPFQYCSSLKAFYGKFASADNRCLIVDGVLEAFAPAGLTEYTIPDSVTMIGVWAFSGCTSLTSVTIPDSVTKIQGDAFNKCTSLKEVYCKPTTPPSLGGSYVFDNNASGRKIYVPAASVDAYKTADGWKEYADYIFPMPEESQNNKIFYTSSDGNVVTPYKTDVFGANIVSNTYTNGQGVIVLDGDATKIGSSAFWGSTSLKSITIPDSVTEILYGAFYECTSLTNITIPDSVTTIGNSAFHSCDALTSVTIPDSVTTIGDSAFHSCTSLKSITIPDSVTSIGEYAFVRCSALTSITIPDSVTSIENNTFVNCSSLTSVTIPNSVTTIGEYAFSNCSALTSITIPDSVISIEKCVFNDCSSLKSVTIPDSVTSIENNTFVNCSSLTSVTIPNSVTTIGEYAFSNCSALTSITIPDSVTTIGNSAFHSCDALTSVTIPDSVTTIGNNAFASCSALKSVTIGNSITSIGKNAFNWCHVLKEVYCKPTTPPSFGGYIFDNNASGRKIYVPTDSVAAYILTDGWSSYSYHIEPYNFTE